MSEIAQTATHLIVIGRGRLIADTSVADFIAAAAPPVVRVLSSDQRALAGLLRSPDVSVTAAGTAAGSPASNGPLMVSGLSAGQVGAAAAAAGITVLQLATEQASLEDAFVDLTSGAVEYRPVTRQSTVTRQPAATSQEEK
jgi:ABC-2 type transport system ATP-binding protein